MEPVKIEIYISKENRPEFNLALEEYLLQTLQKDVDRILLYRNSASVIIGKHQNPWLESNIPFINENKIPLLRRFSGGGAVYHDLGNINFSFFSALARYHPEQNLNVLCNILNKAGINVIQDDKHNLLINQQKISGSAFAIKKDRALHHGTLLVDSDLETMDVALTPTFEQIQTRSTRSRRTEVINLNQINPELAAGQMLDLLADSLSQHYDRSDLVSSKKGIELDREFDEILDKYTTWEWNFGYTPYFEYSLTANTNQQIKFKVKNGQIIQIHGLQSDKTDGGNQPFSSEAVKKIQNVAGLAALSA